MNLLATRRFLPLFITQFLGAFNDNLFKNALVMMIVFKTTSADPNAAQFLVTLSAAVFILPYFLFSATAGQLADKYDRARISRITKLWEFIVVAIGAAGFLLHMPEFLLLVLFMLGVQATFFGPVKYALLPQHLRDDELIAGNAYIEAGTFMAILLGTIGGGVIIMLPHGEQWIVAATLLIALGGYIASRFIPPSPAPAPQLRIGVNIVKDTMAIIRHDRANPRVFRSMIAISWFWLVGAVFLSQFPALAKNVLHGDETIVTVFLTLFSLGIGVGSFLATILSKGAITARLCRHAALAISLFTLDLYWAVQSAVIGSADTPVGVSEFIAHLQNIRILIDLFLIAVASGIYIVPLYAVMQHDSDPQFRARTIASNNVLNALFIVASALATVGLLAAGFSVAHVLLAVAISNLSMVFYTRKI